MTDQGHIPTIHDIQEKALLLPGRPQFWTSRHMAEFYQTTPQRVAEQTRRNPRRFPDDFWFELRDDETAVLVTQFAGPNRITRGVLLGFTKSGALALSGVSLTPIANAVSVQIVRAVIAMEKAAMADARAMVQRLTTEQLCKSALRVRIVEGVRNGLSFEQIVRQGSAPRWKVSEKARECVAMGMTDRLPHGMPLRQGDLFGLPDA